jgi:hypothetical protein
MARQSFAGNTRLEQELDKWQKDNEIVLTKKERREVYIQVLEDNPDMLERLNQSTGTRTGRKLPRSNGAQGGLDDLFNQAYDTSTKVQNKKELNRASQFQGLLTKAAVANAAVNVASRVFLGNGAYNSQVAGKTIEFEDQQRGWENFKRATFLAGSTASLAVVGAKVLVGAASGWTLAAVVATSAGQAARIYNDNQALSGERKRQDLNAQYHSMAFGDIVTRGNR